MIHSCPECGYPLNGEEQMCPECGHPLDLTNRNDTKICSLNEEIVDCSIQNTLKIDLGQYAYESFLIMKYTFWKKFWCFKGRATRREFWSFTLLFMAIPLSFYLFYPLVLIVGILSFFPALGVSVRRLHDNGRSGWWCILIPFATFFYLQKNNPNPNQYGNPELPKFKE